MYKFVKSLILNRLQCSSSTNTPNETATSSLLRHAFTHTAFFIYNNFRSLKHTRDMAGTFVYRTICRTYPPVLSERETIDLIVKESASVSRFGDGEFLLCRNQSIKCQQTSPELARRLQEVLYSNVNSFYVAIPKLLHDDKTVHTKYRNSWREHHVRNYHVTAKLRYKSYLSSFISWTKIYKWSRDEYNDFIRASKAIWCNRNVVLVSNEKINNSLSAHNLLDNAKSLHFIVTPDKNAYSCYASIFEQCKKYPADYLFLLSCGPTATVLAYDLHKSGRQAIDIGHLISLNYGTSIRFTQIRSSSC